MTLGDMAVVDTNVETGRPWVVRGISILQRATL